MARKQAEQAGGWRKRKRRRRRRKMALDENALSERFVFF
jgi:hypothetical protein